MRQAETGLQVCAIRWSSQGRSEGQAAQARETALQTRNTGQKVRVQCGEQRGRADGRREAAASNSPPTGVGRPRPPALRKAVVEGHRKSKRGLGTTPPPVNRRKVAGEEGLFRYARNIQEPQ